ncbi:hypothetical protein FRB94_008518 [Tulasnella sp. JGI-2019a]|nr:hypothetical protein FRB94_008518 [Tulasnella sp. JGI-2019a]
MAVTSRRRQNSERRREQQRKLHQPAYVNRPINTRNFRADLRHPRHGTISVTFMDESEAGRTRATLSSSQYPSFSHSSVELQRSCCWIDIHLVLFSSPLLL